MNAVLHERALAAAVLILGIAAARAAPASTYHFVDLGPGTATAINARGAVAGSSLPAGSDVARAGAWFKGEWHLKGSKTLASSPAGIDGVGDLVGRQSNGAATVWPRQGDRFRLRMAENTQSGYATGISPDGSAIVGYTNIDADSSVNYCYHATLAGGTVLIVGGFACTAWGVNDAGQVAAQQLNDDHLEAVLLDLATGGATFVGRSAGSRSSAAYALNAAGHVAGASTFADAHTMGFRWDGGALQEIGDLGHGSSATAINDGDDVAGTAADGEGVLHAVLYSGGALVDLNPLVDDFHGLAIARVNALGADGTVVGTATAGTQTHGFLLVPQSARR